MTTQPIGPGANSRPLSGRSAFTLAMSKAEYFTMAVNLARSFLWWNHLRDIGFCIITDLTIELPPDLAGVEVVRVPQGSMGVGFSPKLYLDRLAPAAQSLFIDADCLCVGSLKPAFDQFQGHAVSVIGNVVGDGEWFGDIRAVCRQFSVAGVPQFNGGVYYLEPGEACTRVYNAARELEPLYDAIGFRRLRGYANEEVLVSLAMALNGQTPIPEHGDIMNTLMAAPGGLEIDVFKGHSLLRNPKSHPHYNVWYDMEELRPRLVHFPGADIAHYPYRQEELRLWLVRARHWPVWAATLGVNLVFSWPWLICDGFKNIFRPLFHATFGPREIKSARS